MVSFYVLDYVDNIEKCRITNAGARIRNVDVYKIHTEPICTISTDPVTLTDLLLNLRCFPWFRLRVANALVSQALVVIKLVPPKKQHLDYHWGERAVRMLWEINELNEMMAWLSTLGGAFSALGDYQLACADTAGQISIHQMKLAFRLGDPSLVARCRLYLAISLIQKYDFSVAKHIVQTVYRTEKRQTEPETRLLKMCQGIWAKLRYEYDQHQRNQGRKKT
ncbi:uncharacterized protein F58A4.6 [Anopheles bellator]|uniref:uncharacterized protein F58A4.6 n=1 Tax=Anopheles bellator TaxID=139047 RepID=UPI002646FEC0|nr:uncharacterized protein F58A4.6 [Anopheles bellator]